MFKCEARMVRPFDKLTAFHHDSILACPELCHGESVELRREGCSATRHMDVFQQSLIV